VEIAISKSRFIDKSPAGDYFIIDTLDAIIGIG